MKKIVALVLSLVMVLGLATTAFAAFDEDATYFYKDGANFYELTYVEADPEEDGSGVIEHFVDEWNYTWVLCEKGDDNAYALYDGDKAGDKKIGYVCPGEVAYQFTMTKVAANATFNCTTDKNVKGYKWVSPIGVVVYYKDVETAGDTDIFALVGDEVVEVAAQVTYGSSVESDYSDVEAVVGGHAFIQNKAAALDDAETIYEYKCARCGMIVKGTQSKVAGVEYVPYYADPNTITAYWDAGYDVDEYVGMMYIVMGDEAPAVDTEKVESAETFDAGIAMYVGMSVMAAAGSAVVLKKKD